jgi:hypothetical protein
LQSTRALLARILPDASTSLSSEQVWHAFFLHALLRDALQNGEMLILPNTGDHDSRLQAVMERRNKRMVEHGQPEKMHACIVCEKLIPGTGYMEQSKSCYTSTSQQGLIAEI